MPLVVPVLRLMMLFLNIYDSYKTLKIPRPSRRNGGQPSQRALSQRKRDIKGCLAVWIVWSCFVTYERVIEVFISLFVPFYDELKSIGLLFLIFTRARGAEPIFLHVLRPLLKPYTPTLDLFFDFWCMIGDMLFALIRLPINYARDLYRSSMFYNEDVLDSPADLLEPSVYPPVSNGATETQRSYQIWHPRPSSYSGNNKSETKQLNVIDGLPVAQPEITFTSEEAKKAHEEWRQYPAFPSAYPPTPLVSIVSGLPTSRGSTLSNVLSLIPEDAPEQDFTQSFQSQVTSLNPSLSDVFSPMAQSNDGEDMSIDLDIDEESAAEDSDDDVFNTTLQTPAHLGALLQLERETSIATSIQSRSTTLSTNGSILRSQSSSESLSALQRAEKKSSHPRKVLIAGSKASGPPPIRFDGLHNAGNQVKVDSADPSRKPTSPKRKRVVPSPTRQVRARVARHPPRTRPAIRAQESNKPKPDDIVSNGMPQPRTIPSSQFARGAGMRQPRN